jgi:hypothetical protein
MFTPTRMDYFNLAGDPLSQAADRASVCLFLRGDLQTAPHSVALVMTDADLARPAAKIPTLAPNWHWLAWNTRIGTQVLPSPAKAPAGAVLVPLAWQTPVSAYKQKQVLPIAPYNVDPAQLVVALKSQDFLEPNVILDPAKKFFRSETGEIIIDAPRDCLVLDTPNTAGGYGPAGQSIETEKGGVRVDIAGSAATVWVSALDENPIHQSRRLLVTHLTDLQNTDIRYAEPERRTLQDWGRLPYLVHVGQATVTIKLRSPRSYRVWALSPSGKRLGEVPVKTHLGSLTFTADVGADSTKGARMLYEVARNE